MKVSRNAYPREWAKISKRKIAEAGNRCKECGIENNAIVRKRRGTLERVSNDEYVELMNSYSEAQESLRQKEHERILEEERQYLTPERITDLYLRQIMAEEYRNVPGVTVMVDPDQRYGYYSEGQYIPNCDFDDYLSPETAHTLELRALKALRLSRIVLQTNHIDGDKSNCADSNLEVLCQFCHGPKPPYRKRPKRKSP